MTEDLGRSANVLGLILNDPEKVKAITEDPAALKPLVERAIEESDRVTQRAVQVEISANDLKIYRYAILFLGTAIVFTVVGGVVNLLIGTILTAGASPVETSSQWTWAMPESLVALASTAVGALAGLLAPLGGRR